MNEKVITTGMILRAEPIGESDRRLVLLTRDFGKISAFAKGARRPGSTLIATGRPFVFGKMQLYEGRNSYTLDSIDISNYFDDVSKDIDSSCYGAYVMEFVEYYSREGLDATELLRLAYATLLAIEKKQMPLKLIKLVFELRCMAINGEYSENPIHNAGDAVVCAWNYTLNTPLENLYKFNLSDEALALFDREVDYLKSQFIDRKFKSLEILRTLEGT